MVEAATTGLLAPDQLFAEAFVQHADHLRDLAMGAGVDTDLLATLANLSVAPLLRAHTGRLAPLLDAVDDGSPEGAAWQQGYCPICGAWPLLAELRGVELKRRLRCGPCGADWAANRLFCPYCRNDDHRTLKVLRVDGVARYSVTVCDRCQGYLKSANAFTAAPAELLALDDLASMHLDVAAIEQGYQRPEGTGFRMELALPEDAMDETLAAFD